MIRFFLFIDLVALLIGLYMFISGRVAVTTPSVLTAVLGFVGISMVLGSLFSYQQTRTWLSRTDAASGEIIDYEPRASYDSDKNRTTTYYHPTVRFQTSTGQTVTFTSSVGSSQRSYSIGGQVAVRYLPGDPGDAQVDEFMSIWLAPVVLAAIGLPMLLVSLGIAFSLLKA